MPKFCTQCGSQLSEDAAFCTSCGAKVADTEKTTVENTPIAEEVNEPAVEEVKETEETANENQTTEPISEVAEEKAVTETAPESAEENAVIAETPEAQQPTGDSTPLDKGIAFAKDKVGDKYEAFKTSPNRDKYIGFAAIGIVAIVVICVVLSLLLGGGYKSAIKDYMKFYESGDFDDYVDATPDIIYEAQLEGYCDGDEDELEELMEDSLSSLFDEIKSIDYDILNTEKFNSDQLEGLEEDLQDEYEDYVDDDIKVSKAYEVKVKTTTKIKGEDAQKERVYLIVAKVNGDWGVIDQSSSSSIEDYE